MIKKMVYCVSMFFVPLCMQADSLLVAVLMVKNEAPAMELTLQPLVDAGITDFLIYDTGSTDKTIQVTQEFFIKNNISNFVIEQGEWIDFAASRNKALELAQLHFSHAKFMLMLDAEWILHNGAGLMQCCHRLQYDIKPVYFITLIAGGIHLNHPRLIRCRSNVFFVGKVHETTNVIPESKIAEEVYFEYQPTVYGEAKTVARFQRDCEILQQELKDHPDNARAAYFLGQTYFYLKVWSDAVKWCELRSGMVGDEEESYMNMMTLAQAFYYLGEPEKMVACYLNAFEMRSCRAEPLIYLAAYYYDIKYYYLSYIFARHAGTIPYPAHESGLVNALMYKSTRYLLLSLTAHVAGDYFLGEKATLKALEADPTSIKLQEILKYYQYKLE